MAVAGSSVEAPKYFLTTLVVQITALLQKYGVRQTHPNRYINGDVLTGTSTDENGFLGYFNNLLTVIPEGNQFRMFGWLPLWTIIFPVYPKLLSLGYLEKEI